MKPTRDLQSFLDEVRRNHPDHILTFSETLPLDYTATALTMEMDRQGHMPILYFEKLDGYDMPLVANLYASREHIAWGLNTDLANLYPRIIQAIDNLLPARRVETGPVQEVVWLGEEADLSRLPIPRHFEQDAGPYITAGMIAARDPDTGVCNIDFARLMLRGARLLGASIHSRQHLWDYHRRA